MAAYGAFLVDNAKLALDHRRRPHADAVADRVAVVDAVDEPLIGRQLTSVRTKHLVATALPGRIAKHGSRREWINVAPHQRHYHIGQEQSRATNPPQARSKPRRR